MLNIMNLLNISSGGMTAGLLQAIIDIKLDSSIVQDTTFSRNSTASIFDFEGKLKYVKFNEVRFEGVRRVENLCLNSEDLYGDGWNDPLNKTTINSKSIVTFNTSGLGLRYRHNQEIVSSGKKYTVRFKARTISGTNTLRCDINDDTSTAAIFNLDITPKEYSFTSSGNYAIYGDIWLDFTANIGQIELTNIQIENVTGQSNLNPSEYVSNNVLPYPYHGANVDGVKYFNYLNNNTVVNKEIIESKGTVISESIKEGVLVEKQAINLIKDKNILLAPNKGGATIITHMPNEIGASGKKGDVYRIQFGAFGATYIGIAFAPYDMRGVISMYAKQYDPNVSTAFTFFFGTGKQSNLIYPTNDWARYSHAETIVSGTQVYINNVGDNFVTDILVELPQFEVGSEPTSYIETTGATVTRVSDTLTISKFPSKNFTIVMTVKPVMDFVDTEGYRIRLIGSKDSRGIAYEIRTAGSSIYSYSINNGGGAILLKSIDFIKDVNTKVAISLSQEPEGIRIIIYKDGIEKLNILKPGTLDHSNTGKCNIGSWGNNCSYVNFKDVQVYNKKLPVNKFIELTTL